MDIRQLQYLVALAREKHFTRAAQACHVTQPTLSGRIRQLEQELGVPIVERGQRFHGLTPEGERVLKWAHAILDNWTSLQQEIATLRNTSGALTGPAVDRRDPVSAAHGGADHADIQAHHPGVELTVLSQSSIDILRHLEDFTIDVGLTYLDNEPIEGMRVRGDLHGALLPPGARRSRAGRTSPPSRWADAAKQPLCLLTPDMQNRRIIDRAFRAANCAPIPRLETNSVINLCANVHLMGLASIIPEYFLDVIGPVSDVRAVPLADPMVEHSVGLVAVDRDPILALVLAAFECATHTEPPPISRPCRRLLSFAIERDQSNEAGETKQLTDAIQQRG